MQDKGLGFHRHVVQLMLRTRSDKRFGVEEVCPNLIQGFDALSETIEPAAQAAQEIFGLQPTHRRSDVERSREISLLSEGLQPTDIGRVAIAWKISHPLKATVVA